MFIVIAFRWAIMTCCVSLLARAFYGLVFPGLALPFAIAASTFVVVYRIVSVGDFDDVGS